MKKNKKQIVEEVVLNLEDVFNKEVLPKLEDNAGTFYRTVIKIEKTKMQKLKQWVKNLFK